MTHEERKRQEKARARAQMGTLLGRKQDVERPRMVCVCGEPAATVDEILFCKHEGEVA
jgi:hypothetical protein